ncbi:MAG: glucose-6-phosphate dehydrogenase [Nitrospiraceae bacterium]|nr:glucose-6-phosphate dehydrogenase [Nitrospiraceae bacterium]
MIRTGPEIERDLLKKCVVDLQEFKTEPFTICIFGGAGDLSRRKLMPGLMHLFESGELDNGFSIIAFGMPEMDDNQYRRQIEDSLRQFYETPLDEQKLQEFSRHLYYQSSRFEEDLKYKELCQRLDEVSMPDSKGNVNVIFYMAVPPAAVPAIIGKLKKYNLCKGLFNAKIVVEKPFGRDRQSARELNRILIDAFDECQIYRIDHYLSKEPVQNILFFRFSNFIFEQIWNRNYVDNIQITVSEDIGIEHRGAFYEQTGVVRDIVQNHLLQLLGLIAMEPPVGFSADYVRDEKTKVFHSVRIMDAYHVDRFTVRGQYGQGSINGQPVPGYRQEKNIAPLSLQPTFFAARFHVDNLRWAGVPFYVRTGKRMAKRVTEICIQFKQLPLRMFGKPSDRPEPNILVFTVQPDEKISLRFCVKYPYSIDELYLVNMVFGYRDVFKMKNPDPYERLLLDCVKGDLSLFVRQDSVEAMWEIVDPIISRWESMPPKDFPNYAAGSWGPLEAQALVESEERSWITG